MRYLNNFYEIDKLADLGYINKHNENMSNYKCIGKKLKNLWDSYSNIDFYFEGAPIIACYINDFIELLDAGSVFATYHIANPSQLLLRKVFEVYISLKYILMNDTQRKTFAYSIFNTQKSQLEQESYMDNIYEKFVEYKKMVDYYHEKKKFRQWYHFYTSYLKNEGNDIKVITTFRELFNYVEAKNEELYGDTIDKDLYERVYKPSSAYIHNERLTSHLEYLSNHNVKALVIKPIRDKRMSIYIHQCLLVIMREGVKVLETHLSTLYQR